MVLTGLLLRGRRWVIKLVIDCSIIVGLRVLLLAHCSCRNNRRGWLLRWHGSSDCLRLVMSLFHKFLAHFEVHGWDQGIRRS